MHKNVNEIMCVLMAAVAAAGMMTGCSKAAETTADTTAETTAETTVETEEDYDAMPVDPPIDQLDQTTFRERGVYVNTTAKDGSVTLFICSGERNTGGYGIHVVSTAKNGNKYIVTVEETSPAPDAVVTQALTYPCCKVTLDGDFEEVKVVNTAGEEFAYKEYGDFTPDDGYVAVLQGGVGEIAYKTYVYKTDNGYRYVNVTSTTVSWGAARWTSVVDGSNTVSTREKVIEIAKDHNSGDFVIFPGDNTAHPVEDFLSADL